MPQLPDGSTEFFKPVAAAALNPVGGESTEFGIINTTAKTFVVPDLPAGDYYLYAACWDADACCVPLDPTFRVLATPESSPAPAHPPLQAVVVASSRFPCARRNADGACFVDVDDRALTFTAEFDGALVLDSDSYANRGHAVWFLELPGTATGIGPGGSVSAVLTAAPVDLFRVLDVDCVEAFPEERRIDSTIQGNSVSFEFEVTPTEDEPTYDCTFDFDAATLPRVTTPPTDTIRSGPTAPSDGIGYLVLAGLVAGVLFLKSHPITQTGRPSIGARRPAA